MSFTALGKEQMTATEITGSFLNEMKSKNYFNAANFISKAELTWLKNSTIPLLKNTTFLDTLELEPLTEGEISELTESDIFDLWAMLAWEFRDKSFGTYKPDNIIGEVAENAKTVHVVVRDIANESHEAVVYTLVNENGLWKIKLPRIVRGAVEIYQRVST